MFDGKAMAGEVVKTVRDYVARSLEPIGRHLESLEQRIKEIPAGPEGKPGKDGESIQGHSGNEGLPGKDADPELIKELVTTAVASIPKAKDGDPGLPGKDADPEQIIQIVSAEIARAIVGLPPAKDGTPGKDADPELIRELVSTEVTTAVASIPIPKGEPGPPGKDVNPAELAELKSALTDATLRCELLVDRVFNAEKNAHLVWKEIEALKSIKIVTVDDMHPLIANEVVKAAALIPKPKDGESVPIEQVQRMVDDVVHKAVSLIRLPKDGEPGRDAPHLEILPAIDEGKSYPRGTYIKHNGGLWRSFETTAGMKGWECIVTGISAIEFEDHEDGRTTTYKYVLSDGTVFKHVQKSRAMQYQKIWKLDRAYTYGDTATLAGCTWHCSVESTQDRPGTSDAWQMMVKAGRDGKDGTPGARGDPGQEGSPGRDLTQMAPDGSKYR